MGRSVEEGTLIRIIRRTIVKSVVIQLYNRVVQYQSWLKTERYGVVRVVLLIPITLSYQGLSCEVDLKYGGRDVSESSLVFPRSKDGGAG